MSVVWEKFILNNFMRQDINQNLSKHDLKNTLRKLSTELESILNKEETNELVFNSMKNWSYELKGYPLKKIGKVAFLVSGKDKVEIPYIYSTITDYIFR